MSASALIGTDELHLWYHAQPPESETQHRWAKVLSPSEQLRAYRYRSEEHRLRFERGRGMLRHVLSRYIAIDPADIILGESEHGKPYLIAQGTPPLAFNVSHSQDILVIAVGFRRNIGIDVERLDCSVDRMAIAESCFSPSEVIGLRELRTDLRVNAFYRLWCCKEAFLKGLGVGMSRGLNTFTMTVGLEEPTRLVHSEYMDEVENWRFQTLDFLPGYALAIAAEGSPWTLVINRLSFDLP